MEHLNLNNLFSRFNFEAEIEEIIENEDESTGVVTFRYEFTQDEEVRIRTYRGNLVKKKETRKTIKVADRIKAMNLDVLAVQGNWKNIHILKEFNADYLDNLYPYKVLIEGNDPRFIDVGLLSKYPIGSANIFSALCSSR